MGLGSGSGNSFSTDGGGGGVLADGGDVLAVRCSFFENVDRIGDVGFKPTQEDILRARYVRGVIFIASAPALMPACVRVRGVRLVWAGLVWMM